MSKRSLSLFPLFLFSFILSLEREREVEKGREKDGILGEQVAFKM